MANVLDLFRLNGKTALITGGAGLYGRQIVEAVAEAGAKTFMASRNLKAQEEQAAKFRDAGLDVTALQLDQSEESSIRDVIAQIAEAAGKCDVLVNNAVSRPMQPDKPPFEMFAKSMEVNATGIYMMSEIFAQHMAQHGGGSIINIGSIYGLVGPDYTLYDFQEEPTWLGAPADYWFHKGGMVQLTRHTAATYGTKNVRVNCVHPGGFFNEQPEEFVKRYCKRTFLGRMANMSDLKGIIVFLASDASGYITGANIPVDAGFTAK